MNGIPLPEAARQLSGIVVRTLWVLFAGFCLAPVVYLGLYFLVASGDPGRLGVAGETPAQWDQWRFLFGIAGIAALYVSFRLRAARLDPRRFGRRARKMLERLASAGGDNQGADAQSAQQSDMDRAQRLNQAFQDLVGQMATDHVLLWALVEVPDILGLVDWLVSGQNRYLFGLIAISCLGLFAHRPRRGRVEAALQSLWTVR